MLVDRSSKAEAAIVKDNRQNSMRWSGQKGGRVISGQNK